LVRRDDDVLGTLIAIALGKLRQSGHVVGHSQFYLRYFVGYQRKHIYGTPQMERRLRKDGLPGQKRFSNLPGDLQRSSVIVVAVTERDDKTTFGYALCPRENPRRCERSLGPYSAVSRIVSVLPTA